MKNKLLTPGQKITLTGFAGGYQGASDVFVRKGNDFPCVAIITDDISDDSHPIICIEKSGSLWSLFWFTYKTNDDEAKD